MVSNLGIGKVSLSLTDFLGLGKMTAEKKHNPLNVKYSILAVYFCN